MVEEKKVLIVDGYIAAATVFARILKKNRFSVDIAQTSNEAIEKTDTTDYAVAIIDDEIKNSATILLKLSQTRTIRVIITDFPEEALLNGADACLRKIIKPKDFILIIKKSFKKFIKASAQTN